MTYVTSFERIEQQKGYAKGLAVGLEARFGEDGKALADEVRKIENDKLLERVAEKLGGGASLDELRALISPRKTRKT